MSLVKLKIVLVYKENFLFSSGSEASNQSAGSGLPLAVPLCDYKRNVFIGHLQDIYHICIMLYIFMCNFVFIIPVLSVNKETLNLA